MIINTLVLLYTFGIYGLLDSNTLSSKPLNPGPATDFSSTFPPDMAAPMAFSFVCSLLTLSGFCRTQLEVGLKY